MSQTLMSPEVRLAAFALWYNGAALKDICKEVDISIATVNRWIVEDKWKNQREILKSKSFRYTIDSLVSHKNRGLGLLMEKFPKIMEDCANDLADSSLSWKQRAEVAKVLKSTLESCRMMFGQDEGLNLNRKSGTTSGPIPLTNVKDEVIDVEIAE